MILLREDGGGEKGIVEEEVRVRNWWNIFKKWFTDVSVLSSLLHFLSLSFLPWEREICVFVYVDGGLTGECAMPVYYNGRVAKPVHVFDLDWHYEGQDCGVDCAGL